MSIEAIDELMEKANIEKAEVHVVDIDNNEYEGKVCGYTKADDEDDGYATIYIDSVNDSICLSSNEIKNIETL